jgi:hypothetical protein
MSVRVPVVLFLCLLTISIYPAAAKNKKKQQLPDHVLNAQRVLIVIRPDAGEPLTNPTANRTAQDDVERAISKWGRFDLVMEAQTADLVIAVRKGHAGGPMISNSPVDNRSVIFQPSGQSGGTGVRIGAQQGRSPDLTNPGPGPENNGPHISNQIGPSEDMFEVYLGGIADPLDAPPIWRYTAKNALDGPQVVAVEQFRKAIEESEKQRQQKP